MFKEEVYGGLDLVDCGVLAAMVFVPLLTYTYLSFAYRQLGLNGLLLTVALPAFLAGTCGVLVESESPTLLKVFLPGLVSQIAELSQFTVAASSILAIPPVVNLIVDGVRSPPFLPPLHSQTVPPFADPTPPFPSRSPVLGAPGASAVRAARVNLSGPY